MSNLSMLAYNLYVRLQTDTKYTYTNKKIHKIWRYVYLTLTFDLDKVTAYFKLWHKTSACCCLPWWKIKMKLAFWTNLWLKLVFMKYSHCPFTFTLFTKRHTDKHTFRYRTCCNYIPILFSNTKPYKIIKIFQLCVLIRKKMQWYLPTVCKILIILYKGYVRFKGRNSVSTHQWRCHQPDSEAGHTNVHFGICH